MTDSGYSMQAEDPSEKPAGNKAHTLFLCALVALDVLAMGVMIRGVIWRLCVGRGALWQLFSPFLVLVVIMGICMHRGFQRVLQTHPNGLSTTVGWLRGWKNVLKWVFVFAFASMFASGLFHFAVTRLDGVIESWPILAHRDVYLLDSHGKTTAVSRRRYIMVGVSGEAVPCSLFLSFQSVLLYGLLYNEPPFGPKEGGRWSYEEPKPRRKRRPKPERDDGVFPGHDPPGRTEDG